MLSPLSIPRKILAGVAVLLFTGCQPGSNPHPVPSVPQIGADLKCPRGDHGFEDMQVGWGFCYPGTWHYLEKAQTSQSPPGLDLTFDITYVPATPTPCASPPASPSPSAPPSAYPSAAQSPSPRQAASPCSGDYAFMIVSTYERGGAADLASWVNTNLKTPPQLQQIAWGDAREAVRLSDGKRIALTPHHVVILDLHSGLLDLETEMAARLSTWKFSY